MATATALAPLLSAHAAENPDKAAERLLSEARQAAGGSHWDAIATLTETGEFVGGGFSGTYASTSDVPRLLHKQSIEGGLATGAHGWDGHAFWTTDFNGGVRIEEGAEATAAGLSEAYKASFAFLWTDRWPARKTYLGVRVVDNVEYDVISVAPTGVQPFELWLDATTHLVAREADVGGMQPHTLVFSDYREVDGLRLPFKMLDTMGDPKFDTVTTTCGYTLSPALAPASFGAPAPVAMVDPFPPGVDTLTLPLIMDNNLVYLATRINGQAPSSFLFDTGAIDVVDSALAVSLGLSSQGDLPAGGFGADTVSMGIARVSSLELGRFKMANQVLLTTDLARKFKGGDTTVFGAVGYELPQRALVTIDYEREQMTLTRPGHFKPPAGAVAVPFKFAGHVPMVEATLDGVTGQFQVDTGAATGVSVMSPFAKAHDLAARTHATHKVVSGQGLGGFSNSFLGRAHEFKIGGIAISSPLVLIEEAGEGVGDSALTAGNIGGAILRRFTITLDYAHQLVWLQPNKSLRDPEVFDRAGMRLSRQDDGLKLVSVVTDGSAAQAAGVRVGDVIIAVDNQSTREFSMADLRAKFKQAPGTRLTLTLATGSAPAHEVHMALKDLLE